MAGRDEEFCQMRQQAGRLTGENAAYLATYEGAVKLFCRDCAFYKEDERILVV